MASHEDLGRRLDEIAWRQDGQAGQIEQVFETIHHLIDAPEIEAPAVEPTKRFGFHVPPAEAGHTRP